MPDAGFLSAQEHSVGQIEIAVKQIAIPGNGNLGSAHQAINRTWIETADQSLHVSLVIAGFLEPVAKSAQRYIGKRIKVIENDPEFSG